MRLMVTSMRNEGPYILEWIAYHRLIGFDHFLIYSNDCEDGTDALLDQLTSFGVTHVRNDKIGKRGIQWTALNLASKHDLVKQAKWVAFCDVDEFIHIKCGAGTLDDLFAATPDADAIAMTWRLFGNNEVVEIIDQPVIEQFTRAAPFPCNLPWQASQIKTLFRNDGHYGKLGVHRPRQPNPEMPPARWVDGSGNALPEQFARDGIVTYGNIGGMDLVCVNHYSIRSAKAFLVKSERGLPNRSDKAIDAGYWAERNFNQVEELGIQRHLPSVSEAMAEMKDNSRIAAIHDDAVAWHQHRAEAMLDHLEPLQLLIGIIGVTRTDVSAEVSAPLVAKRAKIARAMKAAKGNSAP